MSYTYGSVSHDTKNDAAVHSAVDFLTAHGTHSWGKAWEFYQDGPNVNMQQAPNSWEYKEEWPDVWDEVGSELVDGTELYQ
jgi:hypothetical protein